MIAMVNGYPCATPTEVSRARHGLDPENPTGDQAKADQIATRAGRAVMPAAVFDGVLAPQEEDRIRSSAKAGPVAPPAWRLVDITA
ncbi:hypothetical protein [Phreatobacter sp.]|uniref:hypothetical protein n=1 Tax=Phreatobacter sp. TaxID=1966341 RepID=UPI003F72E8CF